MVRKRTLRGGSLYILTFSAPSFSMVGMTILKSGVLHAEDAVPANESSLTKGLPIPRDFDAKTLIEKTRGQLAEAKGLFYPEKQFEATGRSYERPRIITESSEPGVLPSPSERQSLLLQEAGTTIVQLRESADPLSQHLIDVLEAEHEKIVRMVALAEKYAGPNGTTWWDRQQEAFSSGGIYNPHLNNLNVKQG